MKAIRHREPEDEARVELEDGVLVSEYHANSVNIFADSTASLNEEFIRQPRDLATWGERYTEALRAFYLAKNEVERVRARVLLEVKLKDSMGIEEDDDDEHDDDDAEPKRKPKKARAKSRKPMSVDEVKARVVINEEVIEAEDSLVEADIEQKRLLWTIKAIQAKGDSLVSLAANYRRELDPPQGGQGLDDDDD